MTKIRVLVADDHPLLREGLRRILELEPDIEVVGEARSGEEAVCQAGELLPDVVLMDINMPGGGGVEAARAVRAAYPGVEVVALTIHDDDEYVIELLKAGAKGYILKDVEPHRLAEAIRTVSRGEMCVPASLMSKVVRRLEGDGQRGNSDASEHAALTSREFEILCLIVEGLANREIAQRLFLSEKTIKNYVTSILRKLQVSDRTQAAVYALRHGMIRSA